MATVRDTGGYLVESSEGEVGWVEEVWLDDEDRPRALALQTTDGRHGLLRAEDVLSVDHEQHWVVVPPGQELLELDAPRVRSENGRVVASWRTTGEILPAPSEPHWHWRLHLPHRHPHPHPRLEAAQRRIRRWPPWAAVAALYSALAIIVASMIALAFVIAQLVTGSAY